MGGLGDTTAVTRSRLSYDRLRRVESAPAFQASVVSIIVLSALSAGAKTFDLPRPGAAVLEVLDLAITVFFLAEIALRFAVHPDKRRFFRDGWNVFDTIIVLASLVPLQSADAVLLGRLLRIFRVLRIVSVVPEMRHLVTSLLKALPKLGYIAALMFVIFYIYGAIGATVFRDVQAESGEPLWDDVAIAMLTLFRVATFEDWTDVMYATMEVHPWSWIYYVTFIFLVAFVFLNMMIGVVLDVMTREQNAQEQQQSAQARADLTEHVRGIEAKLDRLIAHLAAADGRSPGVAATLVPGGDGGIAPAPDASTPPGGPHAGTVGPAYAEGRTPG